MKEKLIVWSVAAGETTSRVGKSEVNQSEQDKCRELVAELPEYLRPVLKHMAAGLPIKQTAVELSVTESTVKVYRERVYSKLSVKNAAGATRIAVLAGVL